MILSAPLAATPTPPEHLLLRRTAERSLAVTCKSYAAVHRKRGGAKNFRGDSPKYNTTNPQTWTLTSVGDWSSWKNFSTTAETRTHGAAHELTRIGSGTTPATILYDTKGNITQNQRTPGTSSTYQNYVWDFDNRMISADTNGDKTADMTFEFDALGRRVARRQGATAVVYIHAGQQVVCDYPRGANANTTPAFRYVWGDYIDEPILRQTGSSTLLYYHHNQQYSTIALTSASGLVVTRYGYTAYGDQTIISHSGASQTYATYSNRISYTGRDWDDSLKAHYFRARWYDAVLGRFVNRDPIGYVDGMGLYGGYFNVNGLDPYGKKNIENEIYNKLANLCDTCPTTCSVCDKHTCLDEASRIAKAIKFTFNKARDPNLVKTGVIAMARWTAGWIIEGCGRDERRCGFYCYEWAHGFRNAIDTESHTKCFSAKIEHAHHVSLDGRLHTWVRIESSCSGVDVFLDDGFMTGFPGICHDERPMNERYPTLVPGSPINADDCNPVPHFDCQGTVLVW